MCEVLAGNSEEVKRVSREDGVETSSGGLCDVHIRELSELA